MADTPTPPPPARHRRRRWPYVLAGLALLAAAVLVALPYGIRWQALVWLRDHGHMGADIADVDFNPFSGRLALLALGGGTGEGEELDLDQIVAQVDWLPLLGRRILLKDITMDRVTIDVKKRADGTLVVGRMELPSSTQDEPQPSADPGQPWLLGLGNVDLRNVTVRYSDPLVDTTLLVQELHIDPALQWEPDQDTAFRAELELDGEHWSLSGTMRPFADAPSVDTRVQLRGNVQRRHPRLLGQLGVEDLTLEAHTETRLQARYDLDSGEIELRHQSVLQLRQLQMAVGGTTARVGSLDWDGTITVTGTAAAPRVEVDGALSVTGYGADLAGQEGSGSGESLRWQGPIEMRMEPDKLALDIAGELDLAGIAAALPSAGLRAASLASLRLGDLHVELERMVASGDLELTAGGSVVLQEMAAEHDRGSATLDTLTLALEPLRVHLLREDPQLKATHAGTLKLGGIGAAAPAGTIDDATLTWEGEVQLSAGGRTELAADGTLLLSDLAAGLSSPTLRLTQSRLHWQGELSFAQASSDGTPEIGLTGDLTTEQTRVSNRDSGLSLMELDQLSVEGATASAPRQVAAEEIRLDGLRLLENAPFGKAAETQSAGGSHVLSVAKLRVEEVVAHGEEHLEIDAIRLTDLQAWLTKGQDGEFAFQQALPRSATPTTEPKEPAAAAATAAAPAPGAKETPFILDLGEAHLEGDNRLVYLDSSVDPPFQFEVNPFEIHVGKVDSGDQAGMSPVTLRARTGRYATIEVDGEVGLFATRPTLHLTGKATGINLPPATALAQRHTGYRIRSGLLDADLRVDIDRGILDSETELTANRLEMVKLDPENLDELDKQLGLPLNAALDLLRDSDDNINLVIPVQGDLSDPDIDIGHAVRTALTAGMTKAISTGTLTYLAAIGSALVLPVGAAIAAGKAVSLATALRFAPVPFSPGEGDLSTPAREQLDQLSTLLKERPKVRLTLCGYAASADRLHLQEAELLRLQQSNPPPPSPPPSPQPATQLSTQAAPQPPAEAVELPEVPAQRLLDLAASRSEVVKQYLVESRGLAPGRLLECSPELTEEEGADPRVEVAL